MRVTPQVLKVESTFSGNFPDPLIRLFSAVGQFHHFKRFGDDIVINAVSNFAVCIVYFAAGNRRGLQQRATQRGFPGTRFTDEPKEAATIDV